MSNAQHPTLDLHIRETRGPLGTELMGVSIALRAEECRHDGPDPKTPGLPWDQDDWANAVQHYQPQMLDLLRTHVGGARFHTEPQFAVNGPHSDPIQGAIYVMTSAAWFNPLDLPVDCTARKARETART